MKNQTNPSQEESAPVSAKVAQDFARNEDWALRR